MARARDLTGGPGLRVNAPAAREASPCSGRASCGCAKCGERNGGRGARQVDVPTGPGHALDPAVQRQMERGFAHDFSSVRVHSGAEASAAARALNADAFTVGDNVVLGSRVPQRPGLAARRLLAHELGHVVQQRTARRDAAARPVSAPLIEDSDHEREADTASVVAGFGGRSRVRGRTSRLGVQRRVTPEYAQIEKRLTYNIVDWAITDEEAHEVLQMLSGLSELDLAETVAAMDRDGLAERLLDNIADEDHERFAVLIGKVSRLRSTQATADRIIDRLSYGVFDWAITDQDAHDALKALMGLEPQQLRTLIARLVNERKFDRLMENISAEDQERYAAFIGRLRRLQQEFQALVTSHVSYLRGKSGGAGEAIKKTKQNTGYGGSPTTYNDLPEETRRDWDRRAEAAVNSVRKSVVGTDLEDVVKRSRFQFAPAEMEKNRAYAYVVGKNTLYFGTEWVEDAANDPTFVWQSVSHEIGGHDEFGDTWSWEIMKASLARLTPAEKKVALQGANSLFSAYGYLETEIYAELRELPYRVPGSSGDRPDDVVGQVGDVHDKLVKVLDAFGPHVGREIAKYLYYRVIADPKVSKASKDLLYKEVQEVFGLFPLSSPVSP